MKEPAISLSVVIPTYNRKALVLRAVHSVLDQPDPVGTEVHVVDDGSTDDSLKALSQEFAQAIADQKLILHPLLHREDPAIARNYGIRAARGEWVAFLDSDDQWAGDRLASLAPLLPQHDFIFESPVALSPDNWVSQLIRLNPALTSSVVAKKSLLIQEDLFAEGYYGRFGKRIRGWEDYELWIRCVLALEKAGKLDRIHATMQEKVLIEPQPGGAGRKSIRQQMSREVVTLLKVSPRFKPKYWPLLARRLAGATKGALLG